MEEQKPSRPARFWIEREDKTLEFVYKRTALAAKRAYLKFSRSQEADTARGWGWENFEHYKLHAGWFAWTDTDGIVKMERISHG